MLKYVFSLILNILIGITVYQLYYDTGMCFANEKHAVVNNWIISDLGLQKSKIKGKM